MIPLLLIFIPVIFAVISFGIKDNTIVKSCALLSATVSLFISLYSLTTNVSTSFDVSWITSLGARFSVSLDGMGKMLCLLNTISFVIVFLATYKNEYKKSSAFYGLMLLTQAGLMGVFLATDCLLFYFFWEFALIPVYFLCSFWGGEKRVAVTFKFFIYTFIGSLLMLTGILYLYFQTPEHTFSIQSFYALHLSVVQQRIFFWLFFIAFAIKMPIFPFHTWQADTYEQSPTSVTMILSGVMVKMGLLGAIRWLVPIFPDAVKSYGNIVVILSIIGMIYASLIAIKQDDIKRMIAFSSLAHIGLMAASIFIHNEIAFQGVLIQMFNHGINVIGLWIVADAIEQQLGSRKLSELGGLAQKSPVLAILLIILAFANIALPLTNAFPGEFLMFNGLFQYNSWMAAFAGLSIILAAVYTLNMIQKIFYGNTVVLTEKAVEANPYILGSLSLLIIPVLVFGVYPQPLIDLTKDTLQSLFTIR